MTLPSQSLAVLFGLAAAISWGGSDFSGGMASKRSSSYWVVILSMIIGSAFLVGAVLIFNEPFPTTMDLVYGAIGGIGGVYGLLTFYRALSLYPMGVVAPVGAVVSAAIPALVGFFLEGLPTHLQLLGFGVAFLGVWLISSSNGKTNIDLASLKLSVLAGVGFSIFFIFLDQVSPEAVFWPLISARAASLAVMFLAVWARKDKGIPTRDQMSLVFFTGIFDTGGNIFYALASSYGRLDVSAVVGSLYPGVTVLLAWIMLKEKLTPRQWLGVGAALVSLLLISI